MMELNIKKGLIAKASFKIRKIGLYILFMFLILLFSCQPSPQGDMEEAHRELPDKVDFNFHIKPILSDRCYKCHGPDEKARKGDLRLDRREEAFALLDSAENRYAIVPGNLKKSQLFHRIVSTDPDEMMPPPESNLSLSDHEIALLEKWIEQGAEWKPHWAFILPEKTDLPKIANSNWPKNPVDHFILNRLEQEGLQPSKEASKEKLIRRLSFDLRGLPPSLEEIDAFLENDSPDAYEKLVDRLMAGESYGERMAMEWMDLARYADSHGYQDDIERSMWPWRDWVIEAFNQNMAYDQFVTWQLAGDLLPDANYEQKLATGFNRNHKITQEVGVINEEYRVTYVLDRVNTFSTAFMGLTAECAQCHDHKFDPISQKEYYSLFSFFNNVPEKGRVEYGVEVAEPFLPLPEEKINELRNYIDGLFDKQQMELQTYQQEHWNKGIESQNLSQASISNNTIVPEGLVAWYPLDYIENGQLEEVIRGKPGKAMNGLIPVPGEFSGAVECMGTNYAELVPMRSLNFGQPFTISFWIKSLDGGIRGTVLSSLSNVANDQQVKLSNFELQVTARKNLSFYLSNVRNQSKLHFRSKETIPENQWVQIIITHDGSRKRNGVNLYMDGNLLDTYVFKENLSGPISPTEGLYLGASRPIYYENDGKPNESGFLKVNTKGLVAGQLDEVMLFNRSLKEEEIQQLVHYHPLSAILAKKNKSESDRKRLFYQQLLHEDLVYQSLTERLREYKLREGRMQDIILSPTMVMGDLDTLRPTFVLDRGQYDAPSERVSAGTPKAVLAFNEQYSGNRLGLSEWLFDRQNPLTARVAVNRYWQMIFGQGIVATPGDFGSQGALPSHPALLDWLAVDFRESGWDIKKLLKRMVLSATYRQSVVSNAKLERLDPENRLLGRGPQVRLPAEMVRDHALAISGLLSKEVGGPSVKPYQPHGLWLEVASGNQSLRKYIQDYDQLYRRSLYTFWKRTIPPPSMIVFDAPSREQCNLKRRATSTPMQALVLLNDPQFIESSRLIATRMLKQGGNSAEKRIEFAFRLATSRSPKGSELRLLNDLLQAEQTGFKADPEAAAKLTAVGEYPLAKDVDISELAAYTVVANAILNLTETIRK